MDPIFLSLGLDIVDLSKVLPLAFSAALLASLVVVGWRDARRTFAELGWFSGALEGCVARPEDGGDGVVVSDGCGPRFADA